MKTLLTAAALSLLLAGSARAHDGEHGDEHHKPSNHAKAGEHKDAPKSFDKKPKEGTWARCSVSGDVFKVGKETEFSEYKGRWYPFCCDECKPDFDKEPAKYAEADKT